jgi:HAD superfamily hydrolase (TIGR01484 family)
MIPALLICTDLDRTLLPNGPEPETDGARAVFTRFVSRPEIDLVYVSGRDLRLVIEAMETWRLPEPRFIIGDVGTSIYEPVSERWRPLASWRETILQDWAGLPQERLAAALEPVRELELQEPGKQGEAKLSYYTGVDVDREGTERRISECLARLDLRYRLVFSTDEVAGRGLLDVLPLSAGKLQAIRFLVDTMEYAEDRVVFAGDSGNDLEVLASSLPAVLVANAGEEVRSLALETAARQDQGGALYLARGEFLGMNGNYAAGILEGVAHFFPETVSWMRELTADG